MSFQDGAKARSYQQQLKAKGYDVFVEETVISGQAFTRVLARVSGSPQQQKETLAAMGAPNAQPRKGAAPASQAVPAQGSTPSSAPAVPVLTPPVASPEKPAAPAASANGADPGCRVTATHIEAVGLAPAGFGSPLDTEKRARELAQQNLLRCVDRWRKEQGQIPEDAAAPASVPPGVLQLGDVDLRGDGSVAAVMRVAIRALPRLDIQAGE